ncbi:bifunctional adenosylcobinamide kinase/adenosylcobinamide-phosphate guanylyltransferase [Bacillus tianshenii]|nr:bifunctional adenosylcobinamide kinase/adenosylcobinamide-phosphate guanylyltransferase [Bacillus tianshenii]
MHFVTGGVCQGKKKWVSNYYQLHSASNVLWQSAYERQLYIPKQKTASFLIFEGVEAAIKETLVKAEDDICAYWNTFFEKVIEWESGGGTCVVIGADISKGIVPMEELNRQWRDYTGWCYQTLAAKAERVDVIWCGLPQTLKK